MKFIKLNLKNIPAEESDTLTSYLFEIGAEGISEKLDFIQTSQQYDPEILDKTSLDLEIFFNLKEKENLEGLVTRSPLSSFSPSIDIENDKDWLEEWKKYYAPFCVTGNLWVYPSWTQDQIKEGHEALLVDPGLAFGTGTHATTHLCMEALHELLNEGHGYQSALDMGAGTGILSVLMKKKNISRVLACEIDEMARDKCRENLELNNCSGISVVGPDALSDETYDIVVANIIDGVLLKIKNQLVSSTKDKLLLSGILRENEKEVLNVFLNEKLKLMKRTAKEEWACLLFEKNN
jgi:ribosomal protein L11 methyltransferase